VKFVIDAQLPPSLVRSLAELGHEAEHIAAVGLESASDREVWRHAAQTGAAILTKDEDFASRRLRERRGPVVIWLRIGNCSRAVLTARLLPLMGHIEQMAADGEVLIEIR